MTDNVTLDCPYTFPHETRLDKVNYICGIGGYSSSGGHWPIEFNVATYYCNFDFDHIWKNHSEEHIPKECKDDPELLVAYKRLAQRLHKEYEDRLWSWGQESAFDSLNDSDTYKTLYNDLEPLDVSLELQGRCGKHLVIASFKGRALNRISEDQLREEMMTQTLEGGDDDVTDSETLKEGATWIWPDEEIDIFYRYIRQCEVDFTQRKASAEVEYQGAWQFFANIVNSAWDSERAEIAEHDELVKCAKTVYESLSGKQEEFLTICKAAGVTPEEIYA